MTTPSNITSMKKQNQQQSHHQKKNYHDYQPPGWATVSASQSQQSNDSNNDDDDQYWTMTEIKNGVELTTYNFDDNATKGWYLMGRAVDQVDIVASHESCSRQHARIAFDVATGQAWLRDLGSTHGTAVNKRKLPPEACGRKESAGNGQVEAAGARGVMIFPGDIIQLGASTRLYCVDGPRHYERGNVKARQQQQQQQLKSSATKERQVSVMATSVQQQRHKSNDNDGGGGDAGSDGEDDASPIITSLTEDAIPDKFRKEYEKIKALQYKLTNFQTESGRIRLKGELSAGQEQQLARNTERESQLQADIEQREAALLDKLNHRHTQQQSTNKSSGRQHAADDEEEDDADFYDRTKNDDDDEEEDVVESEQTLTAKWNELQVQLYSVQTSIEQAQAKVGRVTQRLHQSRKADAEDVFFIENELSIESDQLAKHQQRKDAIEKDLVETKRLLGIVNPALLSSLCGSGDQTRRSVRDDDDSTAKQPATTAGEQQATPDEANDSSMMMAPPPPVMRRPANQQPQQQQSSTNHRHSMKPPPSPPPPLSSTSRSMPMPIAASHDAGDSNKKRKRVLGPAMPPKDDDGQEGSSETTTSSSHKRPSNRVQQQGTLAVLTSAMGTTSTSSSSTTTTGAPNKRHHDEATAGSNTNMFQQERTQQDQSGNSNTADNGDAKQKVPGMGIVGGGEFDRWQPPKDQDGSGITKLNAKFAGRY